MPKGDRDRSDWVLRCVEIVVQNARQLGLTGTRLAMMGFLAICLGSIRFGVEPNWALGFFVAACLLDPTIEFLRVGMRLIDERSHYRDVRATTKRRIEAVQQQNQDEPELPLNEGQPQLEGGQEP